MEASEPAEDGSALNLADGYPELAAAMPQPLPVLDLGLARSSSGWHEIVDTLTNIAIERPDRPLGVLVPSLAAWAALDIADDDALERIGIVSLSNRSRNVLRRNHLDTWGEVGKVTPATIGGFLNAGIKVIRDTTRLAIELGAAAALGLAERRLAVLPRSEEPTAYVTTTSIGRWVDDSPMQRLVVWGLLQPDVVTLGDALDRAGSVGAVPNDVADAVAALRGLSLRSLAVAEPPTLASLVRELLGELNETEQTIVRRRVFATTPVTLEKVGAEIGVTRERIRQIQIRAEDRITSTLATFRFAPLHWAAFTLRSRLGSFAPAIAMQREIEALLVGVAPDDMVVASILLRQLAGPYRLERDSYVTEEVWEIESHLVAAADSFGIISMDRVADIVHESGVLPVFHEAVIGFLEHFRRFGESLVVWPNTGVDKLVAILALRGQPADTETLVRECGENYSARALHNRLGEDARVVRVSRREWGLAEWGLEEYSTITEEIAERIERGGGRARLAEVIAEVAQFGVRESSVRMYAEAPMFVIEGEWVRLRGSDEGVFADDRLDEARHTYRLSPANLAYVVDIDHDILRGSGSSLPRGTAVALGVQPGTKTSFGGIDGDVVVSWPLTSMMGPTIGSLRSHALAHELNEGDLLRVVFDTEQTTVRSVGIHAGDLVDLDPSTRAERVTGITGLTGPNVAGALVDATGAPPGTLRRSLTARGDDALLELLPEGRASPELDDALASLARVLGGSM